MPSPIDLASNRDARIGGLDLCYVAAEGSSEQAKALLEARVDPNFRDYEQRSPLHIAAGFGNMPVMQTLLQHGADVNAIDRWGCTPLYQCEQGKHSEAAQMLKDNGAKLQKARLQQQAVRERWEVKRSEVHLGDELGRTLKSTIHRATWNGIDVVAKFILPDEGEDPEDLERELLHEISLFACLRHPDLVMFLGCSLQESPIMFITEFMPGGDLERYYESKARERAGQPWTPGKQTVSRWAQSILRALNFLHNCSEPIIHRDLKPLNILLTNSLEVKVTDFGISRTIGRISPPKAYMKGIDLQVDHKMTAGVGSWTYMAPEVARGKAYTGKIDIYAWALILYFMSSGLQPFHEYSDAERVLDAFAKGEEPRPKSTECPKCFRPSMEAAWDIVPEKRPAAAELIDRLVEDSGNAQCAAGCSLM